MIVKHRNTGFSLLELMIVVAIIAVVAGFALPAYNAYITTAEQGQLISNMKTMQIFQEDYRLRNGAYAVGLANIAAIEAEIGWEPQTDDGITYSIAGDGIMYQVTAVSPSSGLTICMQYPDNVEC